MGKYLPYWPGNTQYHSNDPGYLQLLSDEINQERAPLLLDGCLQWISIAIMHLR